MTTDEPTKPEICGAWIHVGLQGVDTCASPKKGCIMHDAEARERFMSNNIPSNPFALGSTISGQTLNTRDVPIEPSKDNEMRYCKNRRCGKPIITQREYCNNSHCEFEPSNEKVCYCGFSTEKHHREHPEYCVYVNPQEVSEAFLPKDICKCGHEWMWHVHKDIPIRKCTPYPNQCDCVSFEKKVSEAGKVEVKHKQWFRCGGKCTCCDLAQIYFEAELWMKDIQIASARAVGYEEGYKNGKLFGYTMKTLRDNPDGSCECRPLGKSCFFTDGFGNRCDCKCHCPPEPTKKK